MNNLIKFPLIVLVIHLLFVLITYNVFEQETIHKNTIGRITKNTITVDGVIKDTIAPFYSLKEKSAFVFWDAEHYENVKNGGYDESSKGSFYKYAFFPLFPFIWKISLLPPIGVLFLNFIFYALGLLLLLKAAVPPKKHLLYTFFALLIPNWVVYILPYSEATFMLMGSIALLGLLKKKYGIYFLGMFLAALTRPSYTFLLLAILCVEGLAYFQHNSIKSLIKNSVLRTLPLVLGTFIVSWIQILYGSGDWLMFIKVQKHWPNKLSLPHFIRDWSAEGFHMNFGVVILILLPLMVFLLRVIYKQIVEKVKLLDLSNIKTYTLLLCLFYLAGNGLFVLMFRDGSLFSLARFFLCSPFFLYAFFVGFSYFTKKSKEWRTYFLLSLSCIVVYLVAVIDYSTYWSFARVGLFLLIGLLLLWNFQEYSSRKVYKGSFLGLWGLQIVWTAYLLNQYLANGWIYL